MSDEKRLEVIMTGFEIIGNPLCGTLGKVYDPNLSAFAANGEFTGFEIDSVSIETSEFGNTESGRIDAFENREVAFVLNVGSRTSVEETFDLFDFQKRYLAISTFRKFDRSRIHRRFAALLEEFQKRTDGNHVRVGRRRGKSFLDQKNAKTV